MKSSSLIIKGLSPGLTERGKIKVGLKGRAVTSARGTTFNPPVKLDHFLVTTLFRGVDGNYEIDREVHRIYGDKPRALPVRLLFDEIDLNFQCRYACFRGRSLWCTGDGETASRMVNQNGAREEVECPCGRQLPEYTGEDRCKINARLSVLIEGTERVGGVHVLRSTSYNTTVGILSSLTLIKRITGGPLAGLPLELTLNPKTVITPDGKTQNVWIVGVEFKGSIEQLQQIGFDQAKRDAIHYARIERIEQEARLLLAHDPLALKGEADDVVDEFYPDQAEAQAAGKAEPIAPAEPDKVGPFDLASQFVDVPPVSIDPQPTPANGNGGAVKGTPEIAADDPKPKQVRRRANKFQVDPSEWNGLTEIATCGATPDQIMKIKGLSNVSDNRGIILDFMKNQVGYEQLSFMRPEEAENLLQRLAKKESPQEDPPPATANGYQQQMPDDLVECPYQNEGERVSISNYCMTECSVRKRDGFCPVVEEPPAAGGLL